MGWRKKMKKAKRLHRPSLKNWERDGLYACFPSFVDSIRAPSEQYRSFIIAGDKVPRNLPVIIDARTVTPEQFWRDYEATETPCVIRNIPQGFDGGVATPEWPGNRKWPLQELRRNPELSERCFKCGEDDDGDSIKVKLRHFLCYLDKNRDDSPLYIFDSSFEDDKTAKSILSDYTVPSYFREDLFGLVSESRRPPYRWFLVGPERSGTTIHIDPLATNAWNTLIEGQKRWVLFPPHVAKRIVKGRGLIRKHEDDEAIHFFMYILPRIKRRAAELRDEDDYRDFCCYEFTQQAGETVFVPNGWWHAVLNLTDTVGVTQNFCSKRNFDKVWRQTRSGRKRMAWKWLQRLEVDYPDLAARAKRMNRNDGFRMKYDPLEIQRRREEEELRRKQQRAV